MKTLLKLSAVLLVSLGLAARASAQSIDFVPPGGLQEGQSVSVQAVFNSGVPPAYAYLFLRSIGQASYLPLVMRINGNQLQTEIPSSFLKPPGVEYYIQVADIDNQTFTFPAVAPTANPIQLTVSPKPSGFYFTAVYPSDGLTVAEERPLLHVEHTTVGGGLDPQSASVLVDDRPIAQECQHEVGEMFCPVSWDLAMGTHTVVVEGLNRDRQPAAPLRYTFSRGIVKPKRRLSFHGTAVPGLDYVHVDRVPQFPSLMLVPASADRVMPALDLDGKGNVDNALLTMSIRHTGVDRQEQPSPSRYSVSLKTDRTWADGGDYQGYWSDLGLGPTRVRGLRLGHATASKLLTVEVVGGETRRAIEIPELNSSVFARYLTGLTAVLNLKDKLALRLYALDGRDDASSVSAQGRTFIKPIGSRVGGGELSVGLGKGVKATSELAFNRYEPELGSGSASRGRAYQFKLSQDARGGGWSVNYRNVNPSFVSLGNPYLQNDFRGVEAQGSARTPSGGFMLSSSFLTYRDNTEGGKASTFHYLQHQNNLNIRPLPKGPTATLGFGEQRQQTESDVVSTLRTRTRNWVAGISQGLGPFNVGYTYTLTQFRDLSAAVFSDSFDGRFQTVNLSLSKAPWTVSTTFGYNTNSDLRTGNRTRNVNYALRSVVTLKTVKLEAAHSGNVGKDTQSLIDNRQLNTIAQAQWNASAATFWRARYEDISVTNNIAAAQSYKESRSSLSYGFSF